MGSESEGCGRVDQIGYPFWPPTEPDVPNSGIRLLGTIDSLRARYAVHDLGLGQQIMLLESGKPLPFDTAPL